MTTTDSIIDESSPAPMAIIYRSELDYISSVILDRQNMETGGQLFGYLTAYGVPVVCYAIGPGRKANHQTTFFNQDTEYLQSIYNQLNQMFQLQYIGEWHSHHQLGLAKPSGHDVQTIVNGMERHQFRHFLLCIGNCSNSKSTLNAFTFHLNEPYGYQHVPWKVCEMTSPYRPIVDQTLKHLLVHPHSRPNHGDNYLINKGVQQMTVPNYHNEYWLNDKANNLVLKNIIDYLASYSGKQDTIKPLLDHNKHVMLQIIRDNHTETITFGEEFPYSAPSIIINQTVASADLPNWNYTGDILGCFRTYYDEYCHTCQSFFSDKKTEQSKEEEISTWNYWQRFRNY